jgi:hypothetical protein
VIFEGKLTGRRRKEEDQERAFLVLSFSPKKKKKTTRLIICTDISCVAFLAKVEILIPDRKAIIRRLGEEGTVESQESRITSNIIVSDYSLSEILHEFL